MFRTFSVALTLCFALQSYALGQASITCHGTPISGTVRDNTAAIIPGATVTLDGATPRISGADGSFRFPCAGKGKHEITAAFAGFAPLTVTVTAPHAGLLDLRLHAGAQVSVTVDADQQLEPQAPGGANGLTLSGKQLDTLADDPDDLLRELQQLAAASGGSPASTTISVDGFQGDSALPPKDSIAFINVSPDLFSAQYREPPFGGGRVEVYTRPGAKAFHGSLFATNSSSAFNANDPFTTSSAGPIGKQRYGFDLSGPIRKQGSNFSLSLEHRAINEVNVVNAITPGPNGSGVSTLYNVPAPQQLWEASARADWQLNPKNIFSVSYQANVSHISNVGVGGETLQEAGYENGNYDHTVHISDITTLSNKLVHEFRLSIERRGTTNVPDSTAPSVSVAGYFTGGGATIGNLRYRTLINELDDDFILTTKKHLIKAGIQGLLYFVNDDQTTNFNGAYIFGGVANGANYITPLQQYQQALAGTGTATEFNNVTGTPVEKFVQARMAFFFEDNVKLNDKWSASYGLRYFFETNPANYNSVAPRGGISYTPDKKKSWVISAHFGLFNGQYLRSDATELHREDGVQRITSLIYNPVYNNPFAGATPIHAERTTAPGFNNSTYAIGEASISKDLPMGFNINFQEVQLRFLTYARTVNINSPLNGDPYGPRPIAPNLDILQAQNNGTGQGHGEFLGLSNFKQKHVQFFFGGLHLDLRDNTDDSLFFQPQSAYTDAGEQARRDDQGLWMVFGNATFALPCKLSLSMNGFAHGGQPFNITTGTDNNGDGDFNDRPQYAAPGSVANGTTIFQTPLGLLTNDGAYVNGVPQRPIARNLGALPWNFDLDGNLERKFVLTHDPKATHQQTLTANIRSANFLNHTNVTAEGSVLGSPQFLVPIAADTARRIELGLRYSF